MLRRASGRVAAVGDQRTRFGPTRRPVQASTSHAGRVDLGSARLTPVTLRPLDAPDQGHEYPRRGLARWGISAPGASRAASAGSLPRDATPADHELPDAVPATGV